MAGTLVVNADDLGISRGATLGIVRAHREGIVTSASLAVTSPAYGHALDSCVRVCPNLGIGLHFTLTSGSPLSPVQEVPHLVDERGFFRWRFLSLLRATAGQRARELLGEIEIELEAQLQRLFADGIRPDHINGERHIHLIPAIFDLVATAARQHGIPFIRLGRDIGRNHVGVGQVPGLAFGGGLFKSWLLSGLTAINRRRASGGVWYAEHLASYLYTGRLGELLPVLLASPPPEGIVEVMVHPGMPEESQNLALGNAVLERYLASEDRRRELDACVSARGQAADWNLRNFRQLAAELQGRG